MCIVWWYDDVDASTTFLTILLQDIVPFFVFSYLGYRGWKKPVTNLVWKKSSCLDLIQEFMFAKMPRCCR